MTQGASGWETTRLSKHFILLDFLADREVYRQPTQRVRQPLPFNDIWNDEHDALARGLCNYLLEPLMMDDQVGPISIADAFWPSIFKSGHHQANASRPNKHRWAGGEATVDIALYRLVDISGDRDGALREAVTKFAAIDDFRGRVMSYPRTEFVCVTFKRDGAKKCGSHLPKKTQNLRAHHVCVGRYFNLLDFCRNGRAVEEGIDLVPRDAEGRDLAYSPIPEETAARSFAAALDPLVECLGRVSVVRGMETAGFADDSHADLHRWDRVGPWRLVFVLPQGVEPERASALLRRCPHVRDVQASSHASESMSLELVVDQKEYGDHRGLRPRYSQ